ncbi:MAG: 3-hydroxymyristoyl/3-hydroxydecanoyl-(acyl carrier protein) dehydratase [Rhodocyclales bacterium]|nr:3-hydroxymyristoyl/3-hydroxydecanoyl-(acyl carrier protein) dehydratase [Rhodocyclales bacterium]
MKLNREFLIDANEPVFAGHFPTYPILPGVMLLSLARSAMSDHFGRPVQLSEVRRQRFSKPVLPGMRVAIDLQLTPCAGGVEATARWTDASDGSALARAELVMSSAA